MKVETARDRYLVRCDRPGCMAGYLGWNEKCPDCEGGWVDIPEVKASGNLRAFVAYVGFVAVTAVCMYLLFR